MTTALRFDQVINALILLNCDAGECHEHRACGEAIAEVLRSSAHQVDRVQKLCVEEGLEAALGGRQGHRPSYVRKTDGEFEARLVALSCRRAARRGRSGGWRTRSGSSAPATAWRPRRCGG